MAVNSVTLLCIMVMGLTYLAIVENVQNSFTPLLLGSFSHKFGDNILARSGQKTTATTSHNPVNSSSIFVDDLMLRLSEAANPNKTVIITTLNGAWAKKNSMVDLFLKSFHIGNGTEPLLNNLLIVAVDEKALNRCREIHPHCYMMKTEGIDFSGEKVFMSKDYLKMMWRRLRFFGEILDRGYSFVFSDADITWFRDPFTMFSPNADIEFASDLYRGKAEDLQNFPNGGFMYVRSNERTVRFFKFWYWSKQVYPKKNEQDVLNILKFTEFRSRGLRVRFLDTKYFGGYCQRSQDLNSVYTMHANCCNGLKAKLVDLRNTISDWEYYNQQREVGKGDDAHWTPPEACLHSWGN